MRAVILGGVAAMIFAGSATAEDHFSFIGKTRGSTAKVEGAHWFIDLARAEKPDPQTGMTKAWVLTVFRKRETLRKNLAADFRLSRVIFDCRNENYSFEYSAYYNVGQAAPLLDGPDALRFEPAIPSTMIGNATDAACGKLDPTVIFDGSAPQLAAMVREKPDAWDGIPVVATKDPA